MKILYIAHCEFFDGNAQARMWFDQFESQVRVLGHQTTRFDATIDKISQFDVVHAFWRNEPEPWVAISALQPHFVVTPYIPGMSYKPTSLQTRAVKTCARIGRSIIQRRWPPIDDLHFYRKAAAYLAFDQKTEAMMVKDWNITKPIHRLPSEAHEAAKSCAEFYQVFKASF